MPEFKLSGALNNCALHALTPDIKNEIIEFANNPAYDNDYKAEYINLMRAFARFYGLSPLSFKFHDFAKILETYNAFDTQILLGPVLRNFMKPHIQKNEENLEPQLLADEMTLAQYSDDRIKIRADGRYMSLSPEDLFLYVAKPLGFTLSYTKKNADDDNFTTRNLPDDEVQRVAFVAVGQVDIYHQGGVEGAHQGGHWERTNNADDLVNDQDSSQLSTFLPLLGNENPALSAEGFKLLKKHIKLTAQVGKDDNPHLAEFEQLDLTAKQISKYISNLSNVSKALAVKLLGGSLTPATQYFIKHYQIEIRPETRFFEHYINAPANKKPRLPREAASRCKDTLMTLLTPVAPHENYNFILKAGATICATLSAVALLAAVLGLVALISVATAGVGTAGLGAGIVSYGLFKAAHNPNPLDETRDCLAKLRVPPPIAR